MWSVRVAVLGVLVVAGPGSAAAETCIVAPLNPLGISSEESRRVQRWITSAVSGMPKLRLLAARRLERQLRLPGQQDCAGEPRCLGPLARRAGADLVVAGDVGSLSGAYMLYLRVIDGAGTVVRSVNGVLDPKRSGLRDDARSLALQLLRPERYAGRIDVRVDVPGAWIYLDGQRAARGGGGALERIPVGTHALRVTHEAYKDFVQFVQVGLNQTTTVRVALSAYPVRERAMRLVEEERTRPLSDRELPWYRRYWAVTTFGVVVVSVTTAVVAVLASRSVSRDSELVVGR